MTVNKSSFVRASDAALFIMQLPWSHDLRSAMWKNRKRPFLLTMLEWTVACSIYRAMPVTKAFLSSKLVSKFAWLKKQKNHLQTGINIDYL